MRENWEILPPRLKRDLMAYENKEFSETFPRLLSPGFEDVVYKIADCVRPMNVTLGTYFVNAECDPCTEIVFVVDGEMSVLISSAASRSRKPKVAEKKSFRELISPSRSSGAKASAGTSTMGSGSSSSDSPSSAPMRPSLARQDTISLRSLGTLSSGQWFGHWELLDAYDDGADQGEAAMTKDIIWQHSYKAKTACDLMLLVKDDFFLLLDEYPDIRATLCVEPQVASKVGLPGATNLLSLTSSAAEGAAEGVADRGSSSITSVREESIRVLTIDPPSDQESERVASIGVLEPIPPTPKEFASSWTGEEQTSSAEPAAKVVDAYPKLEAAAPAAAPVAPPAPAPPPAPILPADAPNSVAPAVIFAPGVGSSPAVDSSALEADSQPPSLLHRGSSAPGSLPKHMLMKAFDVALSAGAGVTMRASSSGALSGRSSTTCKSPKAAVVPRLPAPNGTTPSRGSSLISSALSPTQRAGWQKLRKFKQMNTPGGSKVVATPGGTALAPAGEGGATSAASDWFKQRVAVELLGDSPSAPWEIEEEALFHRLSTLVSQAASIVLAHAERENPASETSTTAAAPAAAPAAANGESFAVLQMLIAMQRTAQENIDSVRTLMEQRERGTMVQLPSPSPVILKLDAANGGASSSNREGEGEGQ